jgi:membrane protein required for colicin V production
LINGFDAAVLLGLSVAVIVGFNLGLLRSALTIFAYLIAMPIAVWVTSLIAPGLDGTASAPMLRHSLLFFAAFLVAGSGLGRLMRLALDDSIGAKACLADRLAGGALGAVRLGLVAVTMVLVFDQLVPSDRQPAFLAGSRLRPLLSALGQREFRSLPPELVVTINRLKQARG